MVDEEGRGVGHASVIVSRRTSFGTGSLLERLREPKEERLAELVTGDSGYAEWVGPLGPSLRLDATHEIAGRIRVGCYEDASVGQEVLIVLMAGIAVKCRVESKRGDPIVGAKGLVIPKDQGQDAYDFVTDEDGSATTVLPLGLYEWRVVHPEFEASTTEQGIQSDTQAVSIVLDAGVSISGIVTDSEGKRRIGGARVEDAIHGKQTTADGDGTFLLRGYPAECVTILEIECDGFCPKLANVLLSPSKPAEEVQVKLMAEGAADVRVVDDAGRPVVGATVIAVAQIESQLWMHLVHVSTVTNAEGTAPLRGLHDRFHYSLVVEHPSWQTTTLPNWDPSDTTVALKGQPCSLVVIIRESGGASEVPVGSLGVIALTRKDYVPGKTSLLGNSWNCKLGADKRAYFAHLGAGQYVATMDLGSRGVHRQNVTINGDEELMFMVPACVVRVQTDAKDPPVVVALESVNRWPHWASGRVTDDTGRVEFRVEHGIYRLSVRSKAKSVLLARVENVIPREEPYVVAIGEAGK